MFKMYYLTTQLQLYTLLQQEELKYVYGPVAMVTEV